MTVLLLKRACRQAAAWIEKGMGPRDLLMSVNISAGHLSNGTLVEDLRKILKETGLRPRCLKLEITESAVMENAENATEILHEIKSLGVRLSIDDFGTGYSSLSYLHRFPIDTLKVDRSFVNAMTDASGNGEIVKTVIGLAKVLDLSVIAEGIESVGQFERLRALGCEYGQGYLFSRPVPVDQAESLMVAEPNWTGLIEKVPEYSVIGRFVGYEHAGVH
jgi:EAL domain-containing protein (putative c-di-GMP-specific phosphodiesterase class I)